MPGNYNSIFSLHKRYWFIVVVYFVLSLIGISYHELRLDEAQHFLIARDSNSLYNLFKASRIEGHPLLWTILLFIITRLSSNVFYMQLLHIVINCFTVIIICKSNMSIWEKILIIFGYYVFYEFNIISRNYGLSSLLIILLIYQYIKNKDAIIKIAAIIFLLANTHLFSLLASLAFVFAYIVNNRNSLVKQSKKTLTVASLIILTGWLLSVYCIIPPNQYGITFIGFDSTGYFSTDRILKTISVCLKGIFYIPDYTAANHHYHDTLYYLTLNWKTWVIYVVSALAILIPAYLVKNNRFAFTFFCVYVLLYIPVYYFLPLVYGIRYFGFFYLVFICCYWIARPQLSKISHITVSIILALQFINGIYAYSMDLYYPFSESKNISKYIQQEKLPNEKILILNRKLRPAISAYTEEKYFGVENGQPSSYCLWNTYLPYPVLKSVIDTALNSNSSALIVSNTAFNGLLDTTKLQKLKTFDNGILQEENAVIYRYRK